MNREPCRVRDDPYYDYSDYVDGTGVYASKPDSAEDPDDAGDREFIQNMGLTRIIKG